MSFIRSAMQAARHSRSLASARHCSVPKHAIPVYKTSTRLFSARSAYMVKKYTTDHEWIDLPDGSDIGTIGISKYAAHALGDVVFVELPETDADVSAGEAIGAVESVKSASDIMTPVTGKVVETNSALEAKPAGINKDPEGDAWLAKIKVSDKSELDALMDASSYKAFTEEESSS